MRYGNYVEQLTYLWSFKMAGECSRPRYKELASLRLSAAGPLRWCAIATSFPITSAAMH
jgi:hypothetical protein